MLVLTLKTFSFVALSESIVLFLVAMFSTAVTREVRFFINPPRDFYTSCSILVIKGRYDLFMYEGRSQQKI